MDLSRLHQVLAVPTTGEDGATSFLESPIGKAFIGICGAVGIIIVVACIFRMIRHVTGGKPGEGFKILIFGLVIGGLLFNLNLTIDGVGQASNLVEAVFDSVGSITGTGGGGGAEDGLGQVE